MFSLLQCTQAAHSYRKRTFLWLSNMVMLGKILHSFAIAPSTHKGINELCESFIPLTDLHLAQPFMINTPGKNRVVHLANYHGWSIELYLNPSYTGMLRRQTMWLICLDHKNYRYVWIKTVTCLILITKMAASGERCTRPWDKDVHTVGCSACWRRVEMRGWV